MTASLSRYLICALLAIAMLPAAAQAATSVPVPASDALTASAHALAVARWGVDPCGGQVAVTWSHMGAGINARSTWMSVDIHDPSTYSQCSIAYNLDIDWDWPKLCTVIEHELGHLSGHEHVNDPHDVMSPYYVFPTPECLTGQPGALPAPAPVAVAQTPAATTPANATSKRTTVKRKAVKRKVVKRKVAKHKVVKRKTVKAKATAKSAKARSARAKKKAARSRAGAHAAAADSRDHAVLFGCTLVSV
jgi:outer membrane protein assembly factor BamE (lipoprotein component of BamABCDE complex)